MAWPTDTPFQYRIVTSDELASFIETGWVYVRQYYNGEYVVRRMDKKTLITRTEVVLNHLRALAKHVPMDDTDRYLYCQEQLVSIFKHMLTAAEDDLS